MFQNSWACCYVCPDAFAIAASAESKRLYIFPPVNSELLQGKGRKFLKLRTKWFLSRIFYNF
jgi:hypothetical protein